MTGTRKRPKAIRSVTYEVKTGCGSLKLTIGEDQDGTPLECIIKLGRQGTCAAAHVAPIGHLLSKEMRSGLDLSAVIRHLRGVGCPQALVAEGGASSCVDAIARGINMYLEAKHVVVAE